jgi:16S rRNA processing protein RimM
MSSTQTGADGEALPGRRDGEAQRVGADPGPGGSSRHTAATEPELTVARIGAARGLKGEVRLDLRTDTPSARFRAGTVLRTHPEHVGPLTVESVRSDRGAWYVRFAEARDRTSAEALTGVELVAPPGEQEDDAWYRHELVGLRVVLVDGTAVGTVEGFEHLPAQDLLVVRERTGELTLVPFVRAIVPEVDVEHGRVVLDPPGGLLAQFPPAEEAGDGGDVVRDDGEAEPDEPGD